MAYFQERAREQALAAERVKQQERERQEAERKAQEKERIARELPSAGKKAGAGAEWRGSHARPRQIFGLIARPRTSRSTP